jgi:hypothetical protein
MVHYQWFPLVASLRRSLAVFEQVEAEGVLAAFLGANNGQGSTCEFPDKVPTQFLPVDLYPLKLVGLEGDEKGWPRPRQREECG